MVADKLPRADEFTTNEFAASSGLTRDQAYHRLSRDHRFESRRIGADRYWRIKDQS